MTHILRNNEIWLDHYSLGHTFQSLAEPGGSYFRELFHFGGIFHRKDSNNKNASSLERESYEQSIDNS